MNSFKNRVQLIGHLGSDPDVRAFENGKVANFRVATNERYTNKEGKQVDSTEWHSVVAWGALAGLCESFLKKGMQVVVEGKLRTRSYDDKEGKKHYVTEVVASELVFNNPKVEEQAF